MSCPQPVQPMQPDSGSAGVRTGPWWAPNWRAQNTHGDKAEAMRTALHFGLYLLSCCADLTNCAGDMHVTACVPPGGHWLGTHTICTTCTAVLKRVRPSSHTSRLHSFPGLPCHLLLLPMTRPAATWPPRPFLVYMGCRWQTCQARQSSLAGPSPQGHARDPDVDPARTTCTWPKKELLICSLLCDTRTDPPAQVVCVQTCSVGGPF